MILPKNIGFIGAGKVGLALGIFLKKHHLPIAGYYSLYNSDAKKAAAATNSTTFQNTQALLEKCNLIFITTNDDNIEKVAKELANLKVKDIEEKTIVHCSGAHTSILLKSLADRGYSTASVHPLIAISDAMEGAEILHQALFSVQGDDKAITLFDKIFEKTGNQHIVLNPENKPTYHLAAVMLSNYLVTLYHSSNQLLSLSGLNDDKTHIASLTLLESVVKNLKKSNTKDALTGPIKRNDRETVKKHIEILSEKKPDLLSLYKELGKETAKMIENDSILDLFE